MICGHGHEQKFKYPYLALGQQDNSNALPRAKAIDQNLASSRRSVSRLEEANQNPTLCPAPFPRRLDIDRCIKQSIRICWEECCLNRSDSAMITKSVTLEQDGMYMLHITNCQANLCRVVFSSCKLWSIVSVQSKLKHPLPGIPQAFDIFCCLGEREFNELSLPRGGVFDHYSWGVGNLIASFDFMLRCADSTWRHKSWLL